MNFIYSPFFIFFSFFIIYQSTLHTIQLNTTIYKKIQKLTTLESKELIHEDD